METPQGNINVTTHNGFLAVAEQANTIIIEHEDSPYKKKFTLGVPDENGIDKTYVFRINHGSDELTKTWDEKSFAKWIRQECPLCKAKFYGPI